LLLAKPTLSSFSRNGAAVARGLRLNVWRGRANSPTESYPCRLDFCSLFVLVCFVFTEQTMDASIERNIIRLWNLLRRLEREGRPALAVRRRIEAALAERERDAA
jgi:hypothetical protein